MSVEVKRGEVDHDIEEAPSLTRCEQYEHVDFDGGGL